MVSSIWNLSGLQAAEGQHTPPDSHTSVVVYTFVRPPPPPQKKNPNFVPIYLAMHSTGYVMGLGQLHS